MSTCQNATFLEITCHGSFVVLLWQQISRVILYKMRAWWILAQISYIILTYLSKYTVLIFSSYVDHFRDMLSLRKKRDFEKRYLYFILFITK